MPTTMKSRWHDAGSYLRSTDSEVGQNSKTDGRRGSAAWRISVSAEAFARFFHAEAAGSILLLGAPVLPLVWANSPWAELYLTLTRVPVSLSAGTFSFTLSLQQWINDLLMAVFFFVVGLEIKRELVTGELSTVQ